MIILLAGPLVASAIIWCALWKVSRPVRFLISLFVFILLCVLLYVWVSNLRDL